MKYVGSELELFSGAVRWKTYVRDRIAPFVGGRVLEVGAGIGAFTFYMAPGAPDRWTCLEPDPGLLAEIARKQGEGQIPRTVKLVCGTTADIPTDARFDTILYFDVLEHIEDHAAEATRAAALLAPGGRLIILAPAFQFVFSPLDAAVGHFRRYTKRTLDAVRPAGLVTLARFYMDSPGLMLSLVNRLLLRKGTPSKAQIEIWDGMVVPVARVIDPVFNQFVGRSVVAVWQRPGA
jgi:SAM-dependent methyltransferase